MTDYAYILSQNYPDKKWTLDGESYDGLTWLDESPKPSKGQLNAEYEDNKKRYGYIDQRLEAYQKEGITTHALVVAVWERIVENRPESSDNLQAKREVIKQRIPKPSG